MRGHRVELGEIETKVSSHPRVAAEAATVVETADGIKQLALFVVPQPDAQDLDPECQGGGPFFVMFNFKLRTQHTRALFQSANHEENTGTGILKPGPCDVKSGLTPV